MGLWEGVFDGGCNPIGMEDDASTTFLTPITVDVLGNDSGLPSGSTIMLTPNWNNSGTTWPVGELLILGAMSLFSLCL